MPSTTPPTFPHYEIGTNLLHSPATTRVGTIPAHSWGRYRFHQPAAIYDTTSGLETDSHASFRHRDYVSADHIIFSPTLTLTSPAQQAILSTTRYPAPMSRHPAWAYPNHTPQWQSASSLSDTYPTSSSPSFAHKVWLLECKHCQMFLTNRGMKAVLLLRPHVPLYSTDALPVNCSAYSPRSSSTDSSPQRPNEQQLRTCDCLTQSLCCHGCGTGVGYMIVVPCPRCISSSSAANRVTNGHRFVFHSSELIASERHYTPGEPGILSAYTQRPSSSRDPTRSPRSFLPSTPDPADMSTTSPTSTLPHSAMPPPTSESPCPAPAPSANFADSQKLNSQPLRAGDLLYWHHLTQSGEIPGATDEPCARGASQIMYDR